ncbi:MAG: flagellar basal body rod protein FlgC [Clostridiales bacterium]|jgi:flagellar basal-body rod protein FlgC|nr:flagellar basal body rod protein FlgC [Clostridiales bacterium]HOC08807.1 flagellar basal body rod protein FlgC [Bacillota bacterium]HQD41821.1 flagellar basal body rod protein FlgC [Bacillota bacterium]
MGIFNAINVSATGLTAQRLRMDVIAKNIANASTTRTENGLPYRRQVVIFEENCRNKAFSQFLSEESRRLFLKDGGVKVKGIVDDKSPFKRMYDPGHPDADEEGYVLMPNVDAVVEMVNMISAARAYEANVTALNAAKGMAQKALEIGRS